MDYMTKDQIGKARDFKIAEVKAWGGTVAIREFNGESRERWSLHIENNKNANGEFVMNNTTAFLCALCICDQHGNLLYSEDDVPELGKKSAKELEVVFTACMELNGLGADSVEESAKNSVAA